MTILGAMSLKGMVAAMTIEEATDGDIFLAFIQQVLSPALKHGDVVVMDNLSSHKAASACQHRENRCGTALSAALFAGHESHRKGLGKTKGTAPRRSGPNPGSSRTSHRRGPQTDHARQRQGVVQALQLRLQAFPK